MSMCLCRYSQTSANVIAEESGQFQALIIIRCLVELFLEQKAVFADLTPSFLCSCSRQSTHYSRRSSSCETLEA
ncbi:Uncharacterized protein APZ42_015676 [Daphnia magna]|uniref:Uncharacterized protein n=1 Tax=Daphnia magna TaxID=35525 RepID=A0A162NTJ4_9CRUS|nr:Uncharacterized protein APZ42_015676 [Daphnia magna]